MPKKRFDCWAHCVDLVFVQSIYHGDIIFTQFKTYVTFGSLGVLRGAEPQDLRPHAFGSQKEPLT